MRTLVLTRKKYKMKITSILAAALMMVSCGTKENSTTEVVEQKPIQNVKSMASIYDYTVKDIDGNDFSFSSLKGKKVLIVNTASECGYTPQYAQLQELYEAKGGDNFTIIGFPSNNFGGQEPGSSEEIKAFCSKNYGVTFKMMSKVNAKGSDISPIYQWLTQKSLNGVSDATVKWNFHKFLIDEEGNWVAQFPSGVSPLDEEIMNAL